MTACTSVEAAENRMAKCFIDPEAIHLGRVVVWAPVAQQQR